MPTELRNLKITKIALVRKGYRPVNDGARITIVKAEEDRSMSDSAAEASVLERISRGLARLMTGEDPTVEKSTTAKVDASTFQTTADGSHAAMMGKHTHDHPAFYAMQSHSHAHEHANDGDHAHGHVLKAEDAGLPEGWTLVSREDLVKLLGVGDGLSKAETEEPGQFEQITKAMNESRTQLAELQKAIPSDEHIAELIAKGLEPLAKAIEDFAVQFNRQPKTANVTRDIPPGSGLPDGKAIHAAIKDMDFEEATRYLLHAQS
jgi:hypothetical protein